MIVSHRYRFIFLKTGKVGGTSLEIALSKYLGGDDIITPIKAQDERVRANHGFPGPRNYVVPFAERNLYEHARVLRNQLGMGGKLPRKYWNHMPAASVRKALGDKIWNSYFKFSVERNPWDQVVSRYYWDRPKMSFREFVESGRGYRRCNYDLYSINGLPATDYLICYEKLREGLAEVSDKIGLPENVADIFAEIRAKGQFRPSGSPYREHFDERTREIVRLQYAREICLLGYDF
ncbi:hypothetical protein V6X62_02735 [Spiribacter sp. 218]|uniref:hypothetical protein n=1 Tax=Spiribacter pallidus TaxID=1987936 RepID=UPI00349F59AF